MCVFLFVFVCFCLFLFVAVFPGGGQVVLKQNVLNQICSNKALGQQLLKQDMWTKLSSGL